MANSPLTRLTQTQAHHHPFSPGKGGYGHSPQIFGLYLDTKTIKKRKIKIKLREKKRVDIFVVHHDHEADLLRSLPLQIGTFPIELLF